MKKLITFLFLLLIVKYNLGESCYDITSQENCKTAEVDEANALCLIDDPNREFPCQEFTCNDVSDETLTLNQISCSQFKVLDYESCIYNDDEGECVLILKECNEVSRDSEKNCNQHPVGSGKENTHFCAFDSSQKKCIEQYLCESVPKSSDNTEINCEIYPVKLDNKNTHKCVKDISGTNPCKEQVKNIPTTITVPNMETTHIVQTTKNKETILPLISTVLNMETAHIVQTIINKETVLPLITSVLNMENTSKIVETTIPLMYGPTTIIENEMLAILLGCSILTLKTAEFTFICYFHPRNSILTKNITIPIEITYYTYLRRLDNFFANCSLNETNRQTTINYNCVVKTPTANINQIKLREFNSKNGIKLVGITPIAELFFDNFLEADKKYGNLINNNKFIYILNNSTIEKIKSKKIEIDGNIVGDKPKIFVKNKDLTLLVNIESESETENKTTELDCTVGDIKGDNYTLICNITENIKYDLQSSLSIIDSEILLIIFDNNENTNVVLEPENETEVFIFRKNNKKSKGLSTGAIVSIILASIVAMASIIGFAYFGKKKKKISQDSDSIHKIIS